MTQQRLPVRDAPDMHIAVCRRAACTADAPTLLFCGGFHSSMQGVKAHWLDGYCEQRGLGYVRFDYRGHGQSDGAVDALHLHHWLADLEQVLDTITGEILLVGSSMGAWLALQALVRSGIHCRGLLTLAAAPDFTDGILARLDPHDRQRLTRQQTVWLSNRYDDSRWPVTQALLSSGRALSVLDSDLLARVRCPVRLVHAIDDADVPWQQSLAVLEQLTHCDARLQLLRVGDHRLSDAHSLAVVGETLDALLEHPLTAGGTHTG